MSAQMNTTWQSFGSYNKRLLNTIAAHRSNYWLGFISDPLTALAFFFWDAVVLSGNIFGLIGIYTLGLLSWTLFEYAFHRWIYHKGRTLAHAGHQMHHDSPKALIGMPWFMTTGFLWCVWYVLGYRLQAGYTLTFMAGLVIGFNVYGAFHHIHHHFNLKHTWYRKLRIHHKIHHQYPEVNFGVTSPFWDHLFGTTYRNRYGRSLPPAPGKTARSHLNIYNFPEAGLRR